MRVIVLACQVKSRQALLGARAGLCAGLAHPIILAACAGNADMVGRLHKVGDRVDDKMNLMGMFPTSPLLMMATSQRTASMSALLDAGALVDEADK